MSEVQISDLSPRPETIKLGPKPNIEQRVEVEAFLLGFATALRAINEFVTTIDKKADEDLYDAAVDLVEALYPPFDPLPVPRKRGETGNRLDGIVQEA